MAEQGSYVEPGREFTRDTNYIPTRITRDGADGYPVEAGRYRLVVARACPLFVPLVEEGWLDHPATELVAHEYLDPLRDDALDTLVLGCTHYPLLKPLLARVLGPSVRLIDSARETAAATGRVLAAASLAASAPHAAVHRFVVTDAPEQFSRVATHLLGAPIQHVETLALAC